MKPNDPDETALSLLGVDTGGTFTDFVYYAKGQLRYHKCLSTPDAPERAILQGIADLGISLEGLHIVHGSTVATNAVLQGKGVKTVFITNRGFKDMLTIGRQARQRLYDLQPAFVYPPVEADYCLETGGRISYEGKILEPLESDELAVLVSRIKQIKPDAVAINLLFSYLCPEVEKSLADVMPDDVFVSCSSLVLPEYKEYERGMATWLNAWVGPLVKGYLERLESNVQPATVSVMQSSAGTISAKQASERAVNMLLSGPAGGLKAAQFIGRQISLNKLITFDMGGTSTDVALIDGDIRLTSEGQVAGYPVAVPMVDMHTIGAGGGSMATVDAGGLLHVGPESAGASPGPACYGLGGNRPTVTDANLILGRIRADAFLGGRMQLDLKVAEQAMKSVAGPLQCSIKQAAKGIVRLANEHMVRALRVISLQRGVDPREYVLMSFGGAGGLHVCALADAMQMSKAMVPVFGGVLSAFGMLVTPPGRQYSRTVTQPINTVTHEKIKVLYQVLVKKGVGELLQEGVNKADIVIKYSMDCRYVGQSYYLNVIYEMNDSSFSVCQQQFHHMHKQTYGHDLDELIELVNVRVAVTGPVVDIRMHDSEQVEMPNEVKRNPGEQRVIKRDEMVTGEVIRGPLLITEAVATTYVATGWYCEMDVIGNLVLTRA
ncbi:MAG: hydantoinase/oxoprolinase family protein [Gammaproteobacteria bacterium]|nr:hydantoinase/oxoprolinase family protein [Gammaproteobacteria bacterium]